MWSCVDLDHAHFHLMPTFNHVAQNLWVTTWEANCGEGLFRFFCRNNSLLLFLQVVSWTQICLLSPETSCFLEENTTFQKCPAAFSASKAESPERYNRVGMKTEGTKRSTAQTWVYSFKTCIYYCLQSKPLLYIQTFKIRWLKHEQRVTKANLRSKENEKWTESLFGQKWQTLFF